MVEWITLTTSLGGESVAGGKLKEIGTSHWQSPNTGATNETGFTALPSGGRGIVSFGNIGIHSYFWCSKGYSGPDEAALSQGIYNSSSDVISEANPKYTGLPVRCLRD